MVRLDGLLDPETGTRICNRLQGTAEELHRQDQKTARTNRGDSAASGSGDGEQTRSWDQLPAGGSGDGEETRSWDQLRADALDLLTSGDAEVPKAGGGGRPKAEIIAVADIGVLTGDNPAGRCEIPGTGPVPPEVLQRIACDAQLTSVIFADGKPLYHGSTVRTATGAQWRMLIARDRGCVGCGAPPEQCQAHHIVPYARLRRTDIDNLVLVCWRCHHNIHDHHWRVVHQNGKPALQPPDPQAPPTPPTADTPATPKMPATLDHNGHPAGAGAAPSSDSPEIPAAPDPNYHPAAPGPPRPRTGPAPNRTGPDPPASGPDPPPQTPVLFTT